MYVGLSLIVFKGINTCGQTEGLEHKPSWVVALKALVEMFVFAGVPSGGKKKEKEQNLKLSDFSGSDRFIQGRGEFCWETQVRL